MPHALNVEVVKTFRRQKIRTFLPSMKASFPPYGAVPLQIEPLCGALCATQ
jgi:hypothetical protein